MNDINETDRSELSATGAPASGAATDIGATDFGDSGKKSGAKKILLVAIPFLLIAIGGIVAYHLGYIGHTEPDCSTVQETDEHYAACIEELAKAGSLTPGTFIDIPDMIVNLSSSTRQPRFLKIRLKVELENPTAQEKFETVMPRVVDQFQTYLRELRVDDLRGSSGMYRMKIELLSRVRAAAPDVAVRDILFQEILIQ